MMVLLLDGQYSDSMYQMLIDFEVFPQLRKEMTHKDSLTGVFFKAIRLNDI